MYQYNDQLRGNKFLQRNPYHLKRIKAGNARAYHGAYVSILEFFGGYAMAEITPAMIVLWNQKQAAQGKAGSTIRNANSVLNLIFKYWCIGELETQKILGHADISTTRKIYTHIKERQIKEAEKVLNSYFESKVVEKSWKQKIQRLLVKTNRFDSCRQLQNIPAVL